MDPAETPTPEVESVTPEPAPEGGTPAVDYQQRYDDLRPQYDRTMNDLAQLRQWQEAVLNDDEAFAALAAQRGYDIEGAPSDIAEPVYEDPRVSALEQKLAAIEEDRQLAQFETHTEASFKALDKTGDLDEEDRSWIVSKALTLPAGDDGMPDIKTAFEAYKAREDKWAERWAATKKTPHRVSPNGAAGTEQPDMDDTAQRQAWMAARLAALNSDD